MGATMWRPGERDRREVTCPACGRSIPRSNAREYDKHGDRWKRRDKRFEYFCKACHDGLSHQRRDELEELLCDIDAGEFDQETFLRRYWRAVEDRYGTPEER